MTWIAVAIGGAAVLGAGTAVYASGKSSEAAEAQVGATEKATEIQSESSIEAARIMAASSDRATQVQWDMFEKSIELSEPWREAGEAKLGDLVNMIEAGPGEFVPEEDPGYRFGYEEFIEKPTLRAASATGKLGGGGIQKALTRYASDYASTKYDRFLDRWYQSLTPLQSVAGVGQTTASGQGAAAITTGQNVGANILSTGQNIGAGVRETGYQAGQNILAGGQARASGAINQANIWGGYGSGVGQNLLDMAMLKYYRGGSGGTPYIPAI